MSDLKVGHVGFDNCSQGAVIHCTDAEQAIEEIHHLLKVKGESVKMKDSKENKIVKIGQLIEDLLHQIDIANFKDEKGYNLKNNVCYRNLKSAIEGKPLNEIRIILINGDQLYTKTDMRYPEMVNELKNEMATIGDVVIRSSEVSSIDGIEGK